MRTLLLIVSIITSILCVDLALAQDIRNMKKRHLSDFELKGEVKSLRVRPYTYHYKGDSTIREPHTTDIIGIFDIYGVQFDRQGRVTNIDDYTSSDDARPFSSTPILHSSTDTVNKSPHAAGSTSVDGYKTTPIKATTSVKGKPSLKVTDDITYFYNDSAKLTRIEERDEHNKDEFIVTLLNDQGQILQTEIVHGNKRILSSKYVYDTAGRLVAYHRFDKDNGELKSSYENRYDKRGMLVGRTRYIGSSLLMGMPAQQVELQYTYVYDSQGNWVEQIESIAGRGKSSPNAIRQKVIREIQYY